MCKSKSLNKEPPPVNIIPKSIISEACSGGVLSNAFLIAVVIWNTVSAKACLISSDDILFFNSLFVSYRSNCCLSISLTGNDILIVFSIQLHIKFSITFIL